MHALRPVHALAVHALVLDTRERVRKHREALHDRICIADVRRVDEDEAVRVRRVFNLRAGRSRRSSRESRARARGVCEPRVPIAGVVRAPTANHSEGRRRRWEDRDSV